MNDKNFELKPCPFCGGTPILYANEGVRVICNNCKASTVTLVDHYYSNGYHGDAVLSVIERWNKRI